MVTETTRIHANNVRSKLEKYIAPYCSMRPLGSSSSRDRRFQLVQAAKVYVGVPVAIDVRQQRASIMREGEKKLGAGWSTGGKVQCCGQRIGRWLK